MKAPLGAPSPFVEIPLRILALADALLFPAIGIYWVTTWPDKGGLFGAVVASLMVWWGYRRGSSALFAYAEYRWITQRLIKLAILGYLLLGFVWLFKHWA